MSRRLLGTVEGLGEIDLCDTHPGPGHVSLVMDNGEGMNFYLTRAQLTALVALADEAGLP